MQDAEVGEALMKSEEELLGEEGRRDMVQEETAELLCMG